MKKDKTRLSVALCTNADGSEKLEPFFIGHYLKPRAFQKKSGSELGLYYRANSKAWMTGILFQEWLLTLDKHMAKLNRKILMVLDNAPSHVVKDLQLKSIEICFLPPNATSTIQPMDQGIIAAFKKRFRSYQLEHTLEKMDNCEVGRADIYKVDVLKAMRWCQSAWNDISSMTIRNCWMHSGILNRSSRPACDSATQAESRKIDAQLSVSMKRLTNSPFTIEEFINIDEDALQMPMDELDERDIIEMIEAEENEPADPIDPGTDRKGAQSNHVNVSHTLEEKAKALQICIDLFEHDRPGGYDIVKSLSRRLSDLKAEMVQKKQESLKQVSITSYFKK